MVRPVIQDRDDRAWPGRVRSPDLRAGQDPPPGWRRAARTPRRSAVIASHRNLASCRRFSGPPWARYACASATIPADTVDSSMSRRREPARRRPRRRGHRTPATASSPSSQARRPPRIRTTTTPAPSSRAARPPRRGGRGSRAGSRRPLARDSRSVSEVDSKAITVRGASFGILRPHSTGRRDGTVPDFNWRGRSLTPAASRSTTSAMRCRAHVRAAGGRVDPAQVRLAVELGEGVEERRRRLGWPRARRRCPPRGWRAAGLPASARRPPRRRARARAAAPAPGQNSNPHPSPPGASRTRIRRPATRAVHVVLGLGQPLNASSGSRGTTMTARPPGPAATDGGEPLGAHGPHPGMAGAEIGLPGLVPPRGTVCRPGRPRNASRAAGLRPGGLARTSRPGP